MRLWRSVFSMVVLAIVAGPAWNAVAVTPTESKLMVSYAAVWDEFGWSVSINVTMPAWVSVMMTTATVYAPVAHFSRPILTRIAMKAPGRNEDVWHGANSRGAGVARGVYLFRIVSFLLH